MNADTQKTLNMNAEAALYNKVGTFHDRYEF